MIADGNHTANFYVLANRVVSHYVDCGDVDSGVIDLGSLASSEMVVTGARLHPDRATNGGTITYYMSNEDPANWIQASDCGDGSGDVCATFPKSVGRRDPVEGDDVLGLDPHQDPDHHRRDDQVRLHPGPGALPGRRHHQRRRRLHRRVPPARQPRQVLRGQRRPQPGLLGGRRQARRDERRRPPHLHRRPGQHEPARLHDVERGEPGVHPAGDRRDPGLDRDRLGPQRPLRHR